MGELVGALVVNRFNKTHLELDLKINWTSRVTNCHENCNYLEWVDLLQIATTDLLQIGKSLLQIVIGITKHKFITNCDSYYKFRQLLQIVT